LRPASESSIAMLHFIDADIEPLANYAQKVYNLQVDCKLIFWRSSIRETCELLCSSEVAFKLERTEAANPCVYGRTRITSSVVKDLQYLAGESYNM
jgi:hypothetical protein